MSKRKPRGIVAKVVCVGARSAIIEAGPVGTCLTKSAVSRAIPNSFCMLFRHHYASAFATTKLGSEAVEVEPGKWRSKDGKWQYRAKPGDVGENHIHLEELNPKTGEVLQNVHLRWPEGSGRE